MLKPSLLSKTYSLYIIISFIVATFDFTNAESMDKIVEPLDLFPIPCNIQYNFDAELSPFSLPHRFTASADSEANDALAYLKRHLPRPTAVEDSNAALPSNGDQKVTHIKLTTASHKSIPTDLNDEQKSEAYALVIQDTHHIELTATAKAGFFNGAQTLLQIYDAVVEGQKLSWNTVTITDWPRLSHRALMLDSARRHQPVKVIEDTLHWMAYHKLNVFHWHLVDDQGKLMILVAFS